MLFMKLTALGINHKFVISKVLALVRKIWKLFQKSISMCQLSAFRGNFAKINARNIQKVPNRQHQNFGPEYFAQERYFNPLLWWKQSLSSNSEIILSWNIDLNFRETQSAPKRSSEYISSHLAEPIYRLYTASYSWLNL